MSAAWPQHFSPDVVRRTYGGGKLSSYCLALEAWRRGLQVTFYDADLRIFGISDGTRRVVFNDSRPTSITKRSDYQKLIKKWDTKRLMEKEQVPVPRGRLLDTAATSLNDLESIAAEIGYPLVIKPNGGTMGRGVFSNIPSWAELSSSWNQLVEEIRAEEVLIEKHHSGDDYRILVVGDKVVAACLRVPANIEGDGTKSVEELIEDKNYSRKQNPFLSKGLIKIDYEVRQELKKNDMTLGSVPTDGQTVFLRRIANASAGGDVIDVTEALPEAIKDAAIRAVAAIPNVVVAGVDVLYKTGEAATPDTFTVIEMNSRPHIPVNMYPTQGTGQDVPKGMVDYFFPESSRSEQPGDELLNFDVRPLRAALRANVAGSVTLKALPPSHYPARYKYTFDEGANCLPITESQKQELQKEARQLNAAGSLERRGKRLLLMLAGPDRESLQPLREAAEEIIGIPASSVDEWRGVVTAGFRVPGTLLP